MSWVQERDEKKWVWILYILDERELVCYQTVTSDECTKPVRGLYKKDICCCSIGAGWGRPCEECPLKDSSKLRNIVIGWSVWFTEISNFQGRTTSNYLKFLQESSTNYAEKIAGKVWENVVEFVRVLFIVILGFHVPCSFSFSVQLLCKY